jgi:geranylgeranyl diphosphate synthase type II
MEAQSSQSPLVDKSALSGLFAYVARVRPCIEEGLLAHLPLASVPFGARYNEAINYALFPGGKRLRPVLTFLGAELFGGNPASVLPAAVAVEYVHTSSLIFDDLPFMDNARKRRGRLCLHLQFGEAMAVLVALGLLNAAYGLIFECTAEEDSLLIDVHRELVQCIGPKGMIAGQAVDILDTRQIDAPTVSREGHESVRNLKTSAMMKMALQLGAILSGASKDQLSLQAKFALLLGEAFQIKDDLLDLKEDALLTASSRQVENIALKRGAEQARQRALNLVAEAKNVLTSGCGRAEPTRLLCEMADYVMWREA